MSKFMSKFWKGTKISENTTAKVISLVFAVIFWFYVMDQVNPEIEKTIDNVQVELIGVEQLRNNGLIITGDDAFSVSLTIRGRRSDVLDFSDQEVRISADLRGYGKGVNAVPLTKVVFNENIAISDISQADIKVELDQIVDIPKEIIVNSKGNLPAGYEVGEIVLGSSEILVRGPETSVNRISHLSGDVDLNGRDASFEVDIPLTPLDIYGNVVSGVTVVTPTVRTSVTVKTIKTVNVVADITGLPADQFELVEVSVEPTSVTIKGRAEVLRGIRTINTVAIDISGRSASYKKETGLILNEDVEILSDDDSVLVSLVFEGVEAKEFIFESAEIPVLNLEEGLSARVEGLEEIVILTLRDISSVLSTINRNDIALIIDAENLNEGIYELPIEIVGPVIKDDFKLSEGSARVIIETISEEAATEEE